MDVALLYFHSNNYFICSIDVEHLTFYLLLLIGASKDILIHTFIFILHTYVLTFVLF